MKLDTPPPNLALRLLDGAIIIAGLLAFLALLTWASERDLQDAVRMQKEAAHRLAQQAKTYLVRN